MKIACAQIQQEFDSVDTMFRLAEEFLQTADADLVIFPEQYATGWRPVPSRADGLNIRKTWLDLAKKYRKYLVGSYYRPSSGVLENTLLVCSPDGEPVAEYVKMHPFSPGNEQTGAGTVPVTFTCNGMKFGLSICFDLRFPDIYQTYLHDRCDCIIVQAAWPAARIADFELLLKARALETRSFVIGANCIGCDTASNIDYGGRSMVCDCEGKIREDAGVFAGGFVWEVDVPELKETVRTMRESWDLQ
ncbi:MAG TPA: hypothetical protein O0X27_03270 [Methanocorpusculum sp.]|nr:hypothetical protein [Methanocorpusculum sp.]